jgi:hypothetical protein
MLVRGTLQMTWHSADACFLRLPPDICHVTTRRSGQCSSKHQAETGRSCCRIVLTADICCLTQTGRSVQSIQ